VTVVADVAVVADLVAVAVVEGAAEDAAEVEGAAEVVGTGAAEGDAGGAVEGVWPTVDKVAAGAGAADPPQAAMVSVPAPIPAAIRTCRRLRGSCRSAGGADSTAVGVGVQSGGVVTKIETMPRTEQFGFVCR
jgi:hypothetical protein